LPRQVVAKLTEQGRIPDANTHRPPPMVIGASARGKGDDMRFLKSGP
jgi:hypothetical protein